MARHLDRGTLYLHVTYPPLRGCERGLTLSPRSNERALDDRLNPRVETDRGYLTAG